MESCPRSTWTHKIQGLAAYLGKQNSVPSELVDFLKVVAEAEPSQLVTDLEIGQLGIEAQRLNALSRILCTELVLELRDHFEIESAFLEAAAIDLLKDYIEGLNDPLIYPTTN